MNRGFILLPILIVVTLLGGTAFLIIKKPSLLTKIHTQTASFTSSVNPTPTPTPTGHLSGKLVGGYYSKPAKGVAILLNNEIKTISNRDGIFTVTNLTPGDFTMSFSDQIYKFDPLNITVKEGENKIENAIHGDLITPKPTLVSGKCFSDLNGNRTMDSNEKGLEAFSSLSILEGNQWQYLKSIFCGTDGGFKETLIKFGKYRLTPAGKTFYRPPEGQEFVVDGYGNNKTYYFGYIPTRSEGGIRIYVFNDRNENGEKEPDEENVHYQAARIENLSGTSQRAGGNSWNVAVPAEGYFESQLNFGTYRISLFPETSSWEAYFKITKKEVQVEITATSSNQTIYLGAHKLY